MTISAMKQALEALEFFCEYGAIDRPFERIAELKQAIAEAEKQEPVAFRNIKTGDFCTGGFLRKDWAKWQPLYTAPVHARPVVHEVRCTYPQCQATNGCVGACSKTAPVHDSDISQERVDETVKDRHELAGTIPISNGGIATSTPTDFFAPQKREWVGLSDKEVKKIVDKNTSDIWCNGKGVARDVEAKLKEKNNG